MTGQLLADRAKKARAESCCCLCGQLIHVGQRIGRLADGTGWAHITPCIISVRPDPGGSKEGQHHDQPG